MLGWRLDIWGNNPILLMAEDFWPCSYPCCNNSRLCSLVVYYSALIWQKEASGKSDISRTRATCVCHLHWRQWNIRMSYLTYLLVGWVFLHDIWPGRRAHYVNYENINNSNLDGMSLASFCQSRAVFLDCIHITILLAENDNGITAVYWCSIENQ